MRPPGRPAGRTQPSGRRPRGANVSWRDDASIRGPWSLLPFVIDPAARWPRGEGARGRTGSLSVHLREPLETLSNTIGGRATPAGRREGTRLKDFDAAGTGGVPPATMNKEGRLGHVGVQCRKSDP